MKTVIIALNSKYIHSALAPWYLKAYCGQECGEIKVLEYTINHSQDVVLASIYRQKPDNAAFSCYIWNISHVLRIASDLKKIFPDTRIILGGPEVSFDGDRIMKNNPFVDYIINGEGENAFKLLLEHLCRLEKKMQNPDESKLAEIKGLVYRSKDRIVSNGCSALLEDLDLIPSPYSKEMLSQFDGRIVYFESSRGCPFSCSYCLSSTFSGVRYFSMDRVKNDLISLMDAGVKQIKFVDRTFNCNRERAKEIFRFIIDNDSPLNFHFEAAADLFDDEMLDMLLACPEGRIQFEIGIQSTNQQALEAVNRKTDLQKVFHNVRRLIRMGNINIHLDLIAGLPFEGFDTFKKSFNDVYSLNAHQLQLGFLKMLKGSEIRKRAIEHGYCFKNYPPYELLCNKYIDYKGIMELKGIEEVLERYYNSLRFSSTLKYFIGRYYSSPFEFYYSFYNYHIHKGYLSRSISAREQYAVLLDYLKTAVPEYEYTLLNELLKLDFLSSNNSNNLPEGIERDIFPGFKERCFEFLKSEDNISYYLPAFKGMPAKDIYKFVHFELFKYDIAGGIKDGIFKKADTVMVFDYSSKSRVTGLYNFFSVSF